MALLNGQSNQYDNASCMTERFWRVKAMVNHQLANADKYLADFAIVLKIMIWSSIYGLVCKPLLMPVYARYY